MVQIGTNPDMANVFKVHAAPLGLCDNLINALKLERSRRGNVDGKTKFIEADNRSAVDVGDLRRGTRVLPVTKPQFSVVFPEATIREGADELTLRADEVGKQRAFTNTEYTEFERWGPPLVDVDWHAFCQAMYKGIEGKEWEELYFHHREMS